MKKFFKWLGIVLGGLVVLIVVALFVLAFKGNAAVTRTYDISVEQITIPTDAASIARGEHFVKVECTGCHGPDLSGKVFAELPFGYIDALNLTPGKGGAGSEFTDQDWVRAIRHGVTPEGQSLMVMPSTAFWNFSDEDLGAVIAYLKTLPPVDKELRDPHFNLVGNALVGAGVLDRGILIAQHVPQGAPQAAPSAGVSVEYGQYLVNVSGCSDCHGLKLSGGKSSDPSAKAAPNLTPGGELGAWHEADFIQALRTGVALGGRQLDPKQMPWEDFRNFSDDELKAIFMYLQSLPKLPTVIP